MAKRAIITGITGQDGSYLAELLLERLWSNLEAYNAQRLSGWKLSMSAGIARLDAATCGSVQQLLEEADRALYQQKRFRRGVLSGGL